MTALLVSPKSLTFSTVGNEAATAVATNLNTDKVRVWRSTGLTNTYFILNMSALGNYDTVALINSNLRSTDTIRIRGGTTSGNTVSAPTYDSGTINAFADTLPSGSTSKFIKYVSAGINAAYLRIDITATGHPAGFVQAQRLVVGKAVTNYGITYDAEQGFESASVPFSGPNYEAFQNYPSRMTYKARFAAIDDALWRSDWVPFLKNLGRNGFLFTPDYEAGYHQTQACFARLSQTTAVGQYSGYGNFQCEMKMIEVTAS